MEECIKCKRTGNQVKLVDAVYEKEIAKICEECAVSENIPIVRKPTSYQLEASEKPYTVRQRLARMSGVRLKDEEIREIARKDMKAQAGVCEIKGITLDKLRPAKNYSRIIQDKSDLAKRSNKPLDLIDNYNWNIQMARRNRKMTLIQLGAIIGESELVLKLIEQGSLPDDANRIITKLEQFFRINLRKSEQEKEQERISQAKQPARILSFNPDSLKNITISDLKRMKEERKDMENADKEMASKIVWQGIKKQEKKEEKNTGKDEWKDESEDNEIEILDDD